MRFHRLLAALASLFLIAVLAAPAAAQTETVQAASPSAAPEPGLWSVTPFLSFTFGGDADTASLGLGGAFGYDFTTRLSFEGELAYVFDLAGDADDIDWSTLTVSANALFHFPLETLTLVPYATAGLSFQRSSITVELDEEPSSTSDEVGFNLGGGVKAPLTDAIGVRGDIRYFKFSDAAPDGWRLYGGLTWRLRR